MKISNCKIFFLFSLLVGSLNGQISHGSEFSELNKILIDNFSNDFDFSVIIEKNDSLIFSKNYGYIDKEKTIPINENTIYNIASITKSITAIGILKLVEQKELKLTDKIDLFFDNVPNNKKSISIKSLLSHKSGLRQTYPLEGISESNEALDAIFNEDLEFSPGNGFRYSNQNYQLLSLIIERVTGTRFEDYIRDNVLTPLMMKETYFWDEVNEHQNIAPINQRIKESIGKRNWAFIGGGGLFTTTSDLSKFWNGIFKNEFLTKESIGLIFKPYYLTKSGLFIGLGFYKSPTTKWETTELWTRGTESWGHNSVIRFFPEKNLMIIVSTNSGEIENDYTKTGNRVISDLIADFLLD
jgi:CubicO group peptidase (beta-lactamase class C family)